MPKELRSFVHLSIVCEVGYALKPYHFRYLRIGVHAGELVFVVFEWLEQFFVAEALRQGHIFFVFCNVRYIGKDFVQSAVFAYEHLLNLEERLILYRHGDKKTGKVIISVNPMLEETLKPLMNRSVLVEPPVLETVNEEPPRTLTPELLAAECRTLGIGCDIIPKVELDGVTVSSTYIRGLLDSINDRQG